MFSRILGVILVGAYWFVSIIAIGFIALQVIEQAEWFNNTGAFLTFTGGFIAFFVYLWWMDI